jgi:beta propeller repeat protein
VSFVRNDEINPDIENGFIVWQDRRNGDWDIYGYDIGKSKENERPIAVMPGDQIQPRIGLTDPVRGAMAVVWTDQREAGEDIYICENILKQSGA